MKVSQDKMCTSMHQQLPVDLKQQRKLETLTKIQTNTRKIIANITHGLIITIIPNDIISMFAHACTCTYIRQLIRDFNVSKTERFVQILGIKLLSKIRCRGLEQEKKKQQKQVYIIDLFKIWSEMLTQKLKTMFQPVIVK